MNYWLVLLVVVVVVFMFSGGKTQKRGGKSVIHSFPTKLKSSARSLTSGNKMVIGVLVGLALCWFLGNGLVEGFDFQTQGESDRFYEECCNFEELKPNLSQECLAVGLNVAEPLCASISAQKGREGGSEADYQGARLERERAREAAAKAEDDQIIADCCPQGGGGANQQCSTHFQAHNGVWRNFLETYGRLCV